jgi:peptidylprolyl isomerase/FKBP-type peptidyl-prolyl cis-trans isomerase FklB
MIRRAVLFGAVAGALAACRPRAKAPVATGEDQAFLARMTKKPGVKTLPSGLMYEVLRAGPVDGPHPRPRDEVKVHYVGSLVDGRVFDSTEETGTPAVLRLDHLVPAWMEAIPLMRPGDAWMLYVPPKLGYGERGSPPVIPPNAALVFRIELLGVLPSGENIRSA